MMDFLYHCIKPRTYFNGRARLALRSWKCAGAKAHRPLKLCIGFLACGSDTPTKIIVTTQLGNDLEIASFMLLSRFLARLSVSELPLTSSWRKCWGPLVAFLPVSCALFLRSLAHPHDVCLNPVSCVQGMSSHLVSLDASRTAPEPHLISVLFRGE
jgi:hypothetical protein